MEDVSCVDNVNAQESIGKDRLILEAAEKEFLDKGYEGARTTSIAKNAGVTHAMLHYYFRTKEQLFERFLQKKMDEIAPMFSCLFGCDSLPLVERIREAVSAHFDFVSANPDLPKFLINEVLPYKDRCEMFKLKADNLMAQFGQLQKEVDEAAARNEVAHFNVFMFFQTVLVLNVMPSMMSNMVDNLVGGLLSGEDFKAARKAENIELIMRRIQVQY